MVSFDVPGRNRIQGVVCVKDLDEKTFSPVQVRTFIYSFGAKIIIYPAGVKTYNLYRMLKLWVPFQGFVSR